MNEVARWRRRLIHSALIAAGWWLFVWCWLEVTAGRPEAGSLLALVAGALLVVPVLTLSWVLHNVGIYRRKGPRRTVTPAAVVHQTDFNGRTIVADWRGLMHCRRIDIVVDEGHKRFLGPGLAPPTPPAP